MSYDIVNKKDIRLLSPEDLDQCYTESDICDKEIFAEMRTNILLLSGDHYQRKGSQFWDRIRSREDLSQNQKLRLTKNHIKKVISEYQAMILSHAPHADVFPHNEDEIQDQKTAEQNKSVLDYYKDNLKLRSKTRLKGEDFLTFGECWSKTIFDPDKGDFVGYEPLMDEEGNVFIDPQSGYPVPDQEKPIMEGQFEVERMLAFNVLRSPSAQTLDDSPYIIYRKMMKNSELKTIIPIEDHEKVFGEQDETYLVFYGENGTYGRTKSETMVREHYYRPSKQYPRGYFYIATRGYIISQGELPYGIWPIRYEIFDSIPTSPRGRSPIKQMRPYQIEINRAASAIATAQITLGDDKLIMNHGARMSNGGQVPGVRGISLTGIGGEVKVLPGRSGEQYVPYMEKQIIELYTVMGVDEVSNINKDGKLDPYALLFTSIKNRRKFQKYTEAFEEFTISECDLLLELAKKYLEDDKFIKIAGKSQAVNIAEFKNSDKNSYRIKVRAIDTDAETMLGKQLAMNHALQFAGSSLDKEDIGRLLRAMPYLNKEEAFSDLTLKYDNAKNDMLALDRGEFPPPEQYDDHTFQINQLVNRIKKPDFKMLDPQIQENYRKKIMLHQQIDAKQKAELLRAQQGLIPTEGYLVTCDFYVTMEDGKTKRVRLPYQSLNWLINQLKVQGQTLEQLEMMNQGALTEIAKQISQRTGNAQVNPSMQGLPPQPSRQEVSDQKALQFTQGAPNATF